MKPQKWSSISENFHTVCAWNYSLSKWFICRFLYTAAKRPEKIETEFVYFITCVIMNSRPPSYFSILLLKMCAVVHWCCPDIAKLFNFLLYHHIGSTKMNSVSLLLFFREEQILPLPPGCFEPNEYQQAISSTRGPRCCDGGLPQRERGLDGPAEHPLTHQEYLQSHWVKRYSCPHTLKSPRFPG